ncbi:MAG TPA: hypothetical protein VKU42_13865, partial [Candidatus Angelobacter sp.]|nr:hypothetical protein [Candidatus Angelobacter sp.]
MKLSPYKWIFTLILILAALPANAADRGGMEMSTKSAKARAFFEEGLAKMETLHIQAGLQN